MNDQERLKFGYIIMSEKESPCLNCGKSTKRIDVATEEYLCSEKCTDEFDDKLFE